MNNSRLLQTYNHFFWTEKIIEQLNNLHPELIAFQKKIPGFYDSIRSQAGDAFLLFEKNVTDGVDLSECIEQSFQCANNGLNVSVYYLLRDIVYEYTKKEPSSKNLITLSAYIRQYTGLFIQDGFPDTDNLQNLFVLAVKIALCPADLIEEKLLEWENTENSSLKVLSYIQND
jgi:hypothetical protein